jgi:hypothetical protein
VTDIFINYRTADENFAAALIDDKLSQRFGAARVFRASRSIRPGEDFRPRIWQGLRESSALVAVIGPDWLTMAGENGRRLDDPEDWVRREIAEALRLGIRVIPVLLAATPMPRRDQLPADIADLASRQYLRLFARSSRYDIQPLVDALAELLGLADEPEGPAAGQPTAGFGHGGVAFIGGQPTVHGDVVSGDKHVNGKRPDGGVA